MFDASFQIIEANRITKYRVTSDGSPVTYAKVLELWQTDSVFRTYFTELLATSPFPGYRWETPVLTQRTAIVPFEFVLINTPGFASRRTDAQTYRSYFTQDDIDCGVVTFPNIGGDAILVVPSPRTDNAAYGHLAAFLRGAPAQQRDAFWRVIGETGQRHISDKPLWISTAGGGVAWLHVRLDSFPKYYGYTPYKLTA